MIFTLAIVHQHNLKLYEAIQDFHCAIWEEGMFGCLHCQHKYIICEMFALIPRNISCI